jgi:heme-degrading monooxygenase HmoA
MIARVTLAEIDVVRMSIEDATRRFEELILPELRDRDGFAGVYVLATGEGKALVMTLWDNEETAEAGFASGFYEAQVEKFVTLFRAPAGRDTYRVLIAEQPAVAAS